MDKTLLKGLRVLEAITEMDGQPRTIDEIATRVGLTRSNAHRTLQTLAHAGYVAKDRATGTYRATIRLFELGARQIAAMDVRRLAAPYMRELADATGETVHLSVLDGLDVVYIDKIDSPQPVRAYSVVGGRAPAYAVATGKALLAQQPDDYLDRFEGALQRHTPATVKTVEALRLALEKVRRTGYATNLGEWRASVCGLAAPLFNGLSEPVAALGISGPRERLGPAKLRQHAADVLRCAARLSKELGASDAPPPLRHHLNGRPDL